MTTAPDDLQAFVREHPAIWAQRMERSARHLLDAAIERAMVSPPEELLGDFHAALRGHLTSGLSTLRAWLLLEHRVPEVTAAAMVPDPPQWADALAEASRPPARLQVPDAVQRLVAVLHATHADLQDEALRDFARRKLERARWSARCDEVRTRAAPGLSALHDLVRRRLQEAGTLAEFRRVLAEQSQRFFRDPWLTEYLRTDTEAVVEHSLARAGLR